MFGEPWIWMTGLIVVSALDKEEVDFDAILAQVRARFGDRVLPLNVPINPGPGFNQVLDVLRSEVITYAGDRSGKTPAVHVMYAPADPAGEWQHQVLDEGGMAASGCVTADLNADKRPDIVCIGASTGNLRWYENVG